MAQLKIFRDMEGDESWSISIRTSGILIDIAIVPQFIKESDYKKIFNALETNQQYFGNFKKDNCDSNFKISIYNSFGCYATMYCSQVTPFEADMTVNNDKMQYSLSDGDDNIKIMFTKESFEKLINEMYNRYQYVGEKLLNNDHRFCGYDCTRHYSDQYDDGCDHDNCSCYQEIIVDKRL